MSISTKSYSPRAKGDVGKSKKERGAKILKQFQNNYVDSDEENEYLDELRANYINNQSYRKLDKMYITDYESEV